MKIRFPLIALPMFVAIVACDSGSTEPDDFATEDLTAQLSISPNHFHIYETEGTFTVAVTDPRGRAVTDFEEIRLERQRAGTTNWSGTALTRGGDFYSAKYTFETKGSYTLRVTGRRAADTDLKVLYTAPQPLEVVRAHATVAGHNLEFEAVPGHIHLGDTAELNFWIDVSAGHAPAAPGDEIGFHLSVHHVFVTIGSTTDTLSVTQPEAGRFVASHEFSTVGAAQIGIRFMADDHSEQEWSVPVTIHAPH